MPLVSVIMPVYNGEKYLAEAIESILAQTFTDFELLIVDDGSTDGSAEIIRSFEAQDRRIRFFQLESNQGAANARNVGFFASQGEYITNMDCDDISLPQRLQKQVDFMQSHFDVGALGTRCYVTNEDLSITQFEFVVPQLHALIAMNLFYGASFVGTTVMLRREFLASVSGYEPSHRIGEDLELHMRLLMQTDIRFANLSEVLMLYRKHEFNKTSVAKADGTVEEAKLRERALERLWGVRPAGAVDRFQRLRYQHKLGWAEHRATKRDLKRLIDALISHNWVDLEDKPLLIAEMNRRLEQASPRRWQQFCHWRRHRLGF